MKYKLTQKVGRFHKGQILDDKDLRTRRLLQEGDCLESIQDSKKIEPSKENKMEKPTYENKSEGGKL